ncbi:hypothetical protein [Methylobacterium oryzisoli]|uniref:hypothetical protein n=1 Tax=Methylobacterium oryzisoli TaxID=3385502 RepID=UPI003891921D
MFSRSERRHHLRRMKDKAVRVYGRYDKRDPKRHEAIANHLAHCSGPCCGNPRRWFGEMTMQERRAFEAAEA